jgi:Fur family peroxide stress response transcriptional regulator
MMQSAAEFLISTFRQKGLKVTPQRIAVYEAVVNLKNHPTAEQIIEYIKKNHPNISVATVYKVLEFLIENELIRRVKNEEDIMRYDALTKKHHHLYCTESNRIEDYEDPELDRLIEEYFSHKKIKGFKVKDITLQITGEFKNK